MTRVQMTKTPVLTANFAIKALLLLYLYLLSSCNSTSVFILLNIIFFRQIVVLRPFQASAPSAAIALVSVAVLAAR